MYGNTRVSLLWLAGALIPEKYQGRFEVAEISVQASGLILGETLLKGAHLALNALDTPEYKHKGTKFARRLRRALQDVDAALLADKVIHRPKVFYV